MQFWILSRKACGSLAVQVRPSQVRASDPSLRDQKKRIPAWGVVVRTKHTSVGCVGYFNLFVIFLFLSFVFS